MGEEKVKWNIEDKYWKIYSIIIHNANYIPEDSICPILTQKWSQQAADNHPKTDGTCCNIKSRHCTLYWDQEMCKRTITCYPSTNTGKCVHLTVPMTTAFQSHNYIKTLQHNEINICDLDKNWFLMKKTKKKIPFRVPNETSSKIMNCKNTSMGRGLFSSQHHVTTT